jgi:hypothetical protein
VPGADLDVNAFDGLWPYRLTWHGATPFLDWAELGDLRFTHPFYDDTISQSFGRPGAWERRRRSTIEMLEAVAAGRPSVPPTAFIFHMSRCGSTLVSRLLATLPTAIVISEAEPIDGVLRSAPRGQPVAVEQRESWLRWLLAVLGRRRHAQEHHLFVKLDAWNALSLPLIRRAFPTVPWLFVYRDPLEVLVSHRRTPGRHMVPGVLDLGLDRSGALVGAGASLDVYGAHVLSAICTAAADACQPGQALLVNYRQLPEAAWTSIPDFLGLSLSEADAERMWRAARWNAKLPDQQFRPDTAEKHAAALETTRTAARVVYPAYERLEALRARQLASDCTA